MTDLTGREPALSSDHELTGREPRLSRGGKEPVVLTPQEIIKRIQADVDELMQRENLKMSRLPVIVQALDGSQFFFHRFMLLDGRGDYQYRGRVIRSEALESDYWMRPEWTITVQAPHDMNTATYRLVRGVFVKTAERIAE